MESNALDWRVSILQELKLLRSEGVDELAISVESLRLLLSGITRETSDTTRKPASSPVSSSGTTRGQKKEPLQIVIDDPVKESSGNALKPSKATKEDKAKLPAPLEFTLPETSKQEQYDWLKTRILDCPICNENLNAGKKLVVGEGDLDADLFFCGEAPGAEEENEGRPFVGPAGQLLTKMIQAMGLSREKVYIGNIMNWRPQTGSSYGNRPPTPNEMAYCLPFLQAQVDIVKPKVIVALGASATQGLLGMDSKPTIGKLRSHWKEYQNIPLMITYHPSFLLRNTTMAKKRQVWEDLLQVMQKLGLPISEQQQNYFLPG